MSPEHNPDRRHVLRRAADAYFTGLVTKDVSRVPYAENVVFRTPLSDAVITGKANVLALFAGIYALLGEIRIDDYFVNDDLTAICVKAEVGLTSAKTLRVVDLFRIDANGEIVARENQYDPRPALA
jgi:hypothetical protein